MTSGTSRENKQAGDGGGEEGNDKRGESDELEYPSHFMGSSRSMGAPARAGASGKSVPRHQRIRTHTRHTRLGLI